MLESQKEVQLTRLRIPKDSLKLSATIWAFNETQVILQYYDAKLKTETERLSSTYNYDPGNGLLTIKMDSNKQLTFKVAVVSTGSFILLTRRKVKEKS